MINEIIIAIITIAIFFAIRYIVKEKAKGKRCIGCPYSGCCTSKGHCEDEIKVELP